MTWIDWETAKNIGLLVGVVVLVVKAITTTGKDGLIKTLQDELAIARPTVTHYREEMHAVREEAGAKVLNAELELKISQEKLKATEIEKAKLETKTDLSPVMATMKEFILEQRKFTKQQLESNEKQALINTHVLEVLQKLTPMTGGHQND